MISLMLLQWWTAQPLILASLVPLVLTFSLPCPSPPGLPPPRLPSSSHSPLGQVPMRGQSGTSDTAGLPYSCPGKFLAGAGEEAAGG